MSDTIKGLVEAVSCKPGKRRGTFLVSIKVGEEWYGGFTGKDADALGIERGRLVKFNFSENGQYKNFDPKSLQISDEAPQQEATGEQKPRKTSEYDRGASVGHAITTATALAIAQLGSDVTIKDVAKLSVEVLTLSLKLKAGYDTITEKTSPAEPKKAPAKKSKPAPQPEPEEDTDDEVGEADKGDIFDDDIDF